MTEISEQIFRNVTNWELVSTYMYVCMYVHLWSWVEEYGIAWREVSKLLAIIIYKYVQMYKYAEAENLALLWLRGAFAATIFAFLGKKCITVSSALLSSTVLSVGRL